MKCKKSVMGLAAILIVIFHFWMTLTTSSVETGIWRTTYIGVDLFFFLSAYSLGQKKSIPYWSFLRNRVMNIYIPFAIMAGICALYKHWSITRYGLVLCGAEFFVKGGGSFLWFAIAIMLVYLVAPFMVKLKNKLGYIALPILLLTWGVLVAVLQYVFHYTDIFILLNRLPIFFLGLYFEDFRKKDWKQFKLPLILVVLIGGGFLLYQFGGITRLMKPVTDMYYILSIPFTVALVALFDYISEKTSVRNLPLEFIGGITLELYGFQMIFGFDIEVALFKQLSKTSLPLIANKLLSFSITLLLLILIAWVFHLLKVEITKLVTYLKNKKKKNTK